VSSRFIVARSLLSYNVRWTKLEEKVNVNVRDDETKMLVTVLGFDLDDGGME